MKQLLFLFTFCLLTSCNKRIVQLPETTNKDITEVIDVSPVYMFYDEETDSVEFNRRNMISATNWLVNIDKRLTLKQILPHLQYLQEKRQGGEKHSFHNYFTCNNTDLKNLSFIEFTDVMYHEESSGDYLAKVSNLSDSTNVVVIRFNVNDEITILNPNSESLVTTTNLKNLKTSFKEIDSLKNLIYLNFYEDLSFQEYISYKSLFLELDLKQAKFSKQEFLHN